MPSRRPLRRLALATSVGLAACGGADGAATADGVVDAMLGDPDTFVGQFTVDLIAPTPSTPDSLEVDGFTSVLGVVYDKAQPQAILWDPTPAPSPCRPR